MKRTKVQEAIDHISGVRRGAQQHNDTYMIRVCTTALEALCEKREREKNPPLTLEELREMDGEPAFFVNRDGEQRWGVIRVYHDDSSGCGVEAYFSEFQRIDCWNYGETWLAYRRKPDEWGVDGH